MTAIPPDITAAESGFGGPSKKFGAPPSKGGPAKNLDILSERLTLFAVRLGLGLKV